MRLWSGGPKFTFTFTGLHRQQVCPHEKEPAHGSSKVQWWSESKQWHLRNRGLKQHMTSVFPLSSFFLTNIFLSKSKKTRWAEKTCFSCSGVHRKHRMLAVSFFLLLLFSDFYFPGKKRKHRRTAIHASRVLCAIPSCLALLVGRVHNDLDDKVFLDLGVLKARLVRE